MFSIQSLVDYRVINAHTQFPQLSSINIDIFTIPIWSSESSGSQIHNCWNMYEIDIYDGQILFGISTIFMYVQRVI